MRAPRSTCRSAIQKSGCRLSQQRSDRLLVGISDRTPLLGGPVEDDQRALQPRAELARHIELPIKIDREDDQVGKLRAFLELRQDLLLPRALQAMARCRREIPGQGRPENA